MLTGYDKYLFLLRIDFEIWSYYGTQDNALMALGQSSEKYILPKAKLGTMSIQND